ncbi:unnamed protein product [Sphacelaria rigidula]
MCLTYFMNWFRKRSESQEEKESEGPTIIESGQVSVWSLSDNFCPSWSLPKGTSNGFINARKVVKFDEYLALDSEFSVQESPEHDDSFSSSLSKLLDGSNHSREQDQQS